MAASDKTVPLVGGAVPASEVRGNAQESHAHGEVRGKFDTVDRVPIAKLQQQLAKLAQIVNGEFYEAAKPGGFQVDEIKIIAEVTASGELGFVVAGAKAEAKGSIEITFRRAGAKA